MRPNNDEKEIVSLDLQAVLFQLGYLLALIESLGHNLTEVQANTVSLIKATLFEARKK